MSRRPGSRRGGHVRGAHDRRARRQGLRTLLRAAVVTVAALAGGACDFGLVDPSEAELSPARLWIDFRFLEPLGAVTGQVALHAGAGPGGRREVPDRRLWWDGAALDHEMVVRESLIYDVSDALEGSGPVVRIVPPVVNGLEVAPDTVRITLLDVATPDTLRVVRGTALELELAGCCEDALAVGRGFAADEVDGGWSAVFEPDSAGVAAGIDPALAGGDAAPRSPLVVPTDGLGPALEAGSLELSVTIHVRMVSPDGLYEIELWQAVEKAVPFVMLEAATAQH